MYYLCFHENMFMYSAARVLCLNCAIPCILGARPSKIEGLEPRLQLRVRGGDIVFICIAYIPPRQSLRTSLPHPCQSVAELKDSQPNLEGEILAAYLVGNGFAPSFFHNLGREGGAEMTSLVCKAVHFGPEEPSYTPSMLTVHVTGPVHLY